MDIYTAFKLSNQLGKKLGGKFLPGEECFFLKTREYVTVIKYTELSKVLIKRPNRMTDIVDSFLLCKEDKEMWIEAIDSHRFPHI